MDDILQKIRKTIEKEKMLPPGTHVITALSGGADSVCLLLALNQLAEKLEITHSAIHIHHGIRGEEADADEACCRELCEKHRIPLTVLHRDIPALAKQWKTSLEEAGRRERYHCFETTAASITASDPIQFTASDPIQFTVPDPVKTVRVALAHHREDQAETVLMNMCRGTGIRGLGGIPENRGIYIRPLSGLHRREIEEWLNTQGVTWRTDSTNNSGEYTRNRIRHQVIPYLEKEINSQAVEHIAALAAQAREADDFLSQEAAKWIADPKNCHPAQSQNLTQQNTAEQTSGAQPSAVQPPSLALNADSLGSLHPALRRRILRHAICETAGHSRDIGERHILAAEELLEKQVSSRIDLPYGIQARRGYQELFLEPVQTPLGEVGDDTPSALCLLAADRFRILSEVPGLQAEFEIFPWDGTKKISEKMYTKWLDYDKIESDVIFRNRKAGDRIGLPGVGSKKIKSYMIDARIPASLRDQVILLAQGSRILWAAGYRLGTDARVTPETRNILQITLHPGPTWPSEPQT